MKRFTFDDEDESVHMMKRAHHQPQYKTQEKEVVEVKKTKVKHRKSHSLPRKTKTKVKYKQKSSPIMRVIKTFLLIVLFVIVIVAIAFGIRFYIDHPDVVKEWFWQGYHYLFR